MKDSDVTAGPSANEAQALQHVGELHAKAMGISPAQWLERRRQRTLLQRMTTLIDVANLAVLIASDPAGPVTGTAVNMTCGQVVD